MNHPALILALVQSVYYGLTGIIPSTYLLVILLGAWIWVSERNTAY